MPKFPIDLPKQQALTVLRELGFEVVREREHIALRRKNADGSVSTMTLPNHRHIKSATLRSALLQSGVSREAFFEAMERTRQGFGMQAGMIGTVLLVAG